MSERVRTGIGCCEPASMHSAAQRDLIRSAARCGPAARRCVARIALLEDRANVPLPDGTGHPDYVAELAAYGVLGPELDVA